VHVADSGFVPERGARCPAIVAIAASAGGLKALTEVLADLPAEFPWGIAIVQHVHRASISHLADILGRRTALAVSQAQDGGTVAAGHVYIAPPDRHMLVNSEGRVTLTSTALVHFVRPSADLLFVSVAAAYARRAVAVVLSGTGVDGATGVEAIHKNGGLVIVQDPASAEHSGMPKAAQLTGCVDRVLPLQEIGPALRVLAGDWATAQ
jgi:two-component system chemotaxis response regulator CheB